MSGLILNLRPFEQVMINGVLVENGDRRARLRVRTSEAQILRMNAVLDLKEAATPLERAYFIAKAACSGAMASDQAHSILRSLVAEFAEDEVRGQLQRLADDRNFYQIMRVFGVAIEASRQKETPAAASKRAASA